MELTDRLEKYREILKMLDISTKALQQAGFIRDEEARRQEKFILQELQRTERALGAMGKPPVPKLPGRERLLPADANAQSDGAWKSRTEELRKER